MIRTNRDRLVIVSVQGMVAPHVRRQAFGIDADGVPFVLPGVGGITYNVRVGDSAFGWAGDHVEPGVSTAADYDKRGDQKNRAYNVLACIGNKARVISGDAKGALGSIGKMRHKPGGIWECGYMKRSSNTPSESVGRIPNWPRR
jgi:hypothetical protein